MTAQDTVIPPDQKKRIRDIEILSGIVYISASVACWLFGARSLALGIVVGGAVSIINFDLLKRIIEKVFEDPCHVKGYFFLLVLVKFGVLAVLIWVVVGLDFVRAETFAVGFSIILVGLVLEGVWSHRAFARGAKGPPEIPEDDSKPRYVSEAELDRGDKERMLQ